MARRSKQYRDRAEECRHLAKMVTDDELKASYQALAKSYDTLAKEADDAEQPGLCLSGSEPSRLAGSSMTADCPTSDST
jgi:homoserine kinase